MINVAKAQQAYLGLKRAGWVGAGSLLAAIGFALAPLDFAKPFAAALFGVFFFCMWATVFYIALTASHLGRSFWAWLLGSIIWGPITLVIAYYRLRGILSQHRIE